MLFKQKPQLHDILSIKRPKGPVDRLTTYIYLDCQGYLIPAYGLIEDLYRKYPGNTMCVAWGSGGSRLMTLDYAYKRYPRSYGALHVGHGVGQTAVTCRHIHIGANAYHIDMISFGDWRSNKGNCETAIVKAVYNEWHPKIKLPFFSIDFIRSDKIYAIDFDVDPSLRGLGMEDIVKPKDFKNLYRTAQKHFEKLASPA